MLGEIKYNIIRFYESGFRKIVRIGVTKAKAEKWCAGEDSHKVTFNKKGIKTIHWFDGYARQY